MRVDYIMFPNNIFTFSLPKRRVTSRRQRVRVKAGGKRMEDPIGLCECQSEAALQWANMLMGLFELRIFADWTKEWNTWQTPRDNNGSNNSVWETQANSFTTSLFKYFEKTQANRSRMWHRDDFLSKCPSHDSTIRGQTWLGNTCCYGDSFSYLSQLVLTLKRMITIYTVNVFLLAPLKHFDFAFDTQRCFPPNSALSVWWGCSCFLFSSHGGFDVTLTTTVGDTRTVFSNCRPWVCKMSKVTCSPLSFYCAFRCP